MICRSCDTDNPDDAVFCGNCGQALRTLAPPPAAVLPAPPPVATASDRSTACMVCGSVLNPYESVCARCGTPRGARIDPSAPVSASADRVAPPVVRVIGAGTREPLPDDLRGRWNWGAFWLPVPWGLSHNVPQTLWVFALWALTAVASVPMEALAPRASVAAELGPAIVTWPVGIVLCVWYARRGNEWAWDRRRFQSVDHFRQVQRVWAAWSITCMALMVCFAAALAVAAVVSNSTVIR